MSTSNLSPGNIAREIYNNTDKSITTSSFISAKVGNKITLAQPNTVTDIYSFFEGVTLLYSLTIIYTDPTKAVLVSVERTA
jgi:hypothetical protein